MKLDEIFELWSKDSEINPMDISTESLKIPKLHHKYYSLLSKEKLVLRKLESEYAQLYQIKFEYFLGTLDEETLKERNWRPNPRTIIKSDIPMNIESDKDIIDITLRIAYQKEKISALESIVKSVMERNWIIRNFIEWQKFQNGVS
mgnify:FL=1